ncbi:MAG: MBL fold metallo-hydrolase [Clostridia bacterium]
METRRTVHTGDWVTIEKIDCDTFIIRKYRHREETHCNLPNGKDRSSLIDTGLGICNIYEAVKELTHKPIPAIATHIHWDHIGGHRCFLDLYAHQEELAWLNGRFPLSISVIREMVLDGCDSPASYDVNSYDFFNDVPQRHCMAGNESIWANGALKFFTPPAQTPGHLCFYEATRSYLFTGDLVYLDTLFAYYPSTDPEAYLASFEQIAELPIQKVFPAHHSLELQPEILPCMRDAFRTLKTEEKLHYGSGSFDFSDWAVWL